MEELDRTSMTWEILYNNKEPFVRSKTNNLSCTI